MKTKILRRLRRYLLDMLEQIYEDWAKTAKNYFQDTWGLEGAFALQAARLYVALWLSGLAPRITSGFRDPSKQRALQARWDAGDRSGIRVRPATTSKHSTTTFSGNPAATAIDMPCNDEKLAARIAQSLGIGAGESFTVPDPGHYYKLGSA